MNKKYLLLSSIVVLFLVWLLTSRSSDYFSSYVSLYSILSSLLMYLFFFELSKSVEIQRLHGQNAPSNVIAFYERVFSRLKNTYLYFALIMVLFIGTLFLITGGVDFSLQNLASLSFTTMIIFLFYLLAFVLNMPKVLSLNNIPAIVNLIIILPLIFKDRFPIAGKVFDYSILNSTINIGNRPYSLLAALLLISTLILILKYLGKSRTALQINV